MTHTHTRTVLLSYIYDVFILASGWVGLDWAGFELVVSAYAQRFGVANWLQIANCKLWDIVHFYFSYSLSWVHAPITLPTCFLSCIPSLLSSNISSDIIFVFQYLPKLLAYYYWLTPSFTIAQTNPLNSYSLFSLS